MQVVTQSWTVAEGKVTAAGLDATQMEIRPRPKCQSAGLDEYFLQYLGEDLRKLQTTFGVHERRQGFHRKLSDRFPFAIYYQLEDGFVDVVAILDCRSHPDSTDARRGPIKP